MKATKIILSAITAVIIAACSSSKKISSSTVSSTPATTTIATVVPATTATPSITNTFPIIKPANGIYPPGNEELVAIQLQYKDVTLTKLQEGHTLYTQSACIQCHEPLNIYVHNERQWKDIIGDMTQRARITNEQRDAVYKYVLAIKATQPR